MEKAWNEHTGSQVTSRISQCRIAIAEWSRTQHLNSRKMIEHLQDVLDKALSAPIADDANISAINLSLLQANRSEEEFWKQRSRQLWLSLGDKNTGYFHAATKGRKARNRLSVIEDQNGDVIYEEEQIVECIAKYFTEIFTSSNRDCTSIVHQVLTPKIRPEMNEQMIIFPHDC